MIIVFATMIFCKHKLGEKHFNHTMAMQGGYSKLFISTIKSAFKILVSICLMNLF